MSKLRLIFVKEHQASYISHLDMMRTFQRVFPRAGLSLRHSNGFHPHPVLSIVLPLPVGQSSQCELLDFETMEDSDGTGVAAMLNTGLPAGLGAPFFDSVESVLSHLLFAIPAVKGVEFGEGFGFASMRGSQANDPFRMENGEVTTESNHSGGINGGITNGMPVIFRCAVRPTPSIGQKQRTVSLRTGENTDLEIHGRHDPCILPRAVPVVEAMAAIGMMELWKERAACLDGSK